MYFGGVKTLVTSRYFILFRSILSYLDDWPSHEYHWAFPHHINLYMVLYIIWGNLSIESNQIKNLIHRERKNEKKKVTV